MAQPANYVAQEVQAEQDARAGNADGAKNEADHERGVKQAESEWQPRKAVMLWPEGKRELVRRKERRPAVRFQGGGPVSD